MTTFQFLVRLITFRPLLYTANALAWTIILSDPDRAGIDHPAIL